MRVVSWNMNHCLRSAESRARAWEYLMNELKADIAIVQEASPTDGMTAVYRAIDASNPRYRWGSAVVAFRDDLELQERKRVPLADCNMQPVRPNELPDSHPGASAVADVLSSAGEKLLTVVSLYGQWETMPDGRTIYSCARLHRMLSDLTSVLSKAKRDNLMVAGDLNITTQIAYEGQRDVETDGAAAVLARIKSWGMKDCIAETRHTRPRLENCTCPEPDTCVHVQTFRLANRENSRPTQLDYAFVSEKLATRLRACEVVHAPQAWALSDHCPIIVDLTV
jgi:exonuclease III